MCITCVNVYNNILETTGASLVEDKLVTCIACQSVIPRLDAVWIEGDKFACKPCWNKN